MNGIGYADNFNHFRRLRPQARFGAQPPKAALSAKINTIILHSAFHILHSGGTPVNNNLQCKLLWGRVAAEDWKCEKQEYQIEYFLGYMQECYRTYARKTVGILLKTTVKLLKIMAEILTDPPKNYIAAGYGRLLLDK